jgi:pyruvate kinase
VGGELRSRKGLNLPGIDLGISAFTDHDRACLAFALEHGVDAVSQSFVESAADIRAVRDAAAAVGGRPFVIAKIERAGALDHYDEILAAADGIMVARGDLGVEVPIERIAVTQKSLIARANLAGKPVITATQMLESMVSSRIPTRAEATDVANAILDGTDAVMLSAETAAGEYPVQTVEAMARICVEAEKSAEVSLEKHFLDRLFTRIDQSIAMAALFAASHLQVKAIAAMTESGSTALWMSRLNVGVPIYALTQDVRTRYKVSIFKGVYPLMMRQTGHDRDELLREAEEELMRAGAVEPGDLIVLTIGEPIGTSGGTNTLKIVQVGDPRIPD